MVTFLISSLNWSSLWLRNRCFMYDWCGISEKFCCCTVSLYISDVLWWGFFFGVFGIKEVGECDGFFCFVFLFWMMRIGPRIFLLVVVNSLLCDAYVTWTWIFDPTLDIDNAPFPMESTCLPNQVWLLFGRRWDCLMYLWARLSSDCFNMVLFSSFFGWRISA